jgi:hypothetical protein
MPVVYQNLIIPIPAQELRVMIMQGLFGQPLNKLVVEITQNVKVL